MCHHMIYVTDDHVDSATYLVRLLRAAGYGAESFSSAMELLDQLAIKSPRLVVLDMMMPEMSGLECLSKIRANPATAGLPVIIYTADFTHDAMEAARRAGANEVVIKGSIEFADFLALVKKHGGLPGTAPATTSPDSL